ncbi:MAG: DUF3795 domain-containing protein [Candidatus Cloacimonadaceae bacterium]|nr:DUF3795 domain-containing protein [Candidatus Cloacimonadaceae bacterium]
MNTLIAPCGIDCQVCDAYIATQTQDDALKQKMVDNYKEQMGKEISFAELDCDGCISNGRHIGFCAQCEIRACAFGKGYETCAQCTDFPCETGSFIWTASSQSKASLEAIKASL